MKKILILTNSSEGLYDFRRELVWELLKEYQVYISVPDEIAVKKLKEAEVNQGGNSFNSAFAQAKPDAAQTLTNLAMLTNQLQMNALANMDRSVYIKNLLGLPQNLAALFWLRHPKR